jgi:threonylcarbamoyladenosine tRNA methylthiotransferase MtaB
MNIFFDVVGCRLNQSEVERLANTFRALGHQVVGDPVVADIAIINTCAVTVKAAADSRKKLRRASRLGAKHVIATGCWASLYPEKAMALEGVTQVFLNDDKENIAAILLDLSKEEIAHLELIREPLPGDRGRTRAFIKVQEGCDNHCTYCLTRLARGKSRSMTLETIKRDIHAAIDGGAKEIVLTGVQLGGWGKDFREPKYLSFLIQAILDMDGFERLRLSSIEPWDFNMDMIPLWQDDRLCRHLHIPLQSGDDRILKRMGRPIEKESYKNLITALQTQIPDIAITTDVIAGFPGETNEIFDSSQDFIQEIGFAGGHVFTYSPRPGTAAYKMENQVPIQIAKERNAFLRKIFHQKGIDFRQRFIGKSGKVLWETSEEMPDGPFRLSGLTDNYIRVFATSKENLWNELSSVDFLSHLDKRNALIGEITDPQPLDEL